MKNLSRIGIAVAAVAMFGLSCAHFQQVPQSDVIRTANRAAEAAGYRLNDYEQPKVIGHEGHTWIVSYEGKTPPAGPDGMVELQIGDHFGIFVDDRSGKTRIIPGQ